jgi:hypothetical protein
MKEYFRLQFKMTNRKMADFGLNPIIGFCLLFAGFIGLSIYLFSKTEFAEYAFILIALSFVSKLSETKRNDYLKYCFRNTKYRILRLTENFIVALPFMAFLIYEQLFPSVIILSILTLLLALVNFNSTYNYTIPTPFYKKPFEFTVGFRSTFYLFIFAYFLTFMAVYVGNFNLGIFALLLVFLISISFYSKLENEYYVWASIDTPKGFLVNKIKTGLTYSTFIGLPILIVLGVFFFSQAYTLLIFLLLGYVYLFTIILAKYSGYPNEMNLPQGILIGISLLFPPILIGIIPFFYLQSIKRLKVILE